MKKLKDNLIDFNKIICIGLITLIILFIISCSKSPEKEKNSNLSKDKNVVVANEVYAALKFGDIIGKWRLKYSGDYGYDFRFYKNYKSLVILYLRNESIVFKGVYTVEDDNKIKINIYEMKRARRVTGIDIYHGFVKVKSSYFLFIAHLTEKNKKKILQIRPLRIIIDGNNSDGYFEPVIKLKKI